MMQTLPIILTLLISVIWTCGILLLSKFQKKVFFTVFCALVNFGLAIWSAILVFLLNNQVSLNVKWFSVGAENTFWIFLNANPQTLVFWILLCTFTLVFSVMSLYHLNSGQKLSIIGESSSLPLLFLGAFIAIVSENFFSFYFGWALVSFAGFIGLIFSAPTQKLRSLAALRYLVILVFIEVIFLSGMLGIVSKGGDVSFHELNQKYAFGGLPAWAVMCLVCAGMFKSLQLPFTKLIHYIVEASYASLPVMMIGHGLLSSVIFLKLFPIIQATIGTQYLSLIPVFTSFIISLLMLPERNPVVILGWISSYVASSVILSGLLGSYLSTHTLLLNGNITIMLLMLSFIGVVNSEKYSRWFMMLACLSFLGCPFFGWGWARYVEYLYLVQSAYSQVMPQDVTFVWTIYGCKVFSDLLIGIGLWGIVRDFWKIDKEDHAKAHWGLVSAQGFIFICSLSLFLGGRIMGGLLEPLLSDLTDVFSWFEKIFVSSFARLNQKSIGSLIGAEPDVIARIVVFSGVLLPFIISTFWLFRDQKNSEKFRAKCERFLIKVGLNFNQDLWGDLFDPILKYISKIFLFFENKIFKFLLLNLFEQPVRLICQGFHVFEEKILDKKTVDQIGVSVGSIGKALRLFQNGHVQFYFSLGIVFLSVIIIRFILLNG